MRDVILLEFGFNTLEELYERVRPALHSKKLEMDRLGYLDVEEINIWDYLKSKWKNSSDLTLSDIVDDILNTRSEEIYLHKKKDESQQQKNIEV